MKRIIQFILTLGLLFCSTCAPAPAQDLSRKVSPNDSLTLTFKLTKEENTTQEVLNTLLTNSATTNAVLSTSIEKLTDAVSQGVEQSKLTKMDIVGKQMGVTKETLQKAFKRNNTIILICLIPALLVILYSLWEFLNIKGLDIKNTITGTALMTGYSLLGAGLLYVIISLIFNSQYFTIRSLLSALF